MLIALGAKNKLKLIIGEYEEPSTTSSLRAYWERSNDMLISWILNTPIDTLPQPMSLLDQWFTSASPNTIEFHVHARMDQLQNQLNQVLMMMQNAQNDVDGMAPHVAGDVSGSNLAMCVHLDVTIEVIIMKLDFSGLESSTPLYGASNELLFDGFTAAPAFDLPVTSNFDEYQKKSVQMVKPAKGTTTLAFIFEGGVMVAADSRASMGGYICMRLSYCHSFSSTILTSDEEFS
ncbi:proteasome subunit beta type-5 [Tanacetum coccineum]|uniref:Proteasome subunit beta type-5 n=1 Tax=Tanacetum coccineum TaxID=301880 RepID=A0ABQ5F0P9_9ASTR